MSAGQAMGPMPVAAPVGMVANMDLAGVTLPNPVTVNVTGVYPTVVNKVAGGSHITPLRRYRPNGTSYLRPTHLIRLSFDSLAPAEKNSLITAANAATTYPAFLRLTGLGVSYFNPLTSGTETDTAAVMLSTDGMIDITPTQEWKIYNGGIVGPLLFTVNISLYAGDIEFIFE